MIEKERQKRLRNVVVLVEGGVVNSGVIEQRVRINKNQVPGAN